MYCQKCGYKVRNGSSVCDNCGAEVFAEYCGGFWDILDESAVSGRLAGATAGSASAPARSVSTPTRSVSAPAVPNPPKREGEWKEKAMQREQAIYKKFNTRLMVLAAVCGLLSIGLLVQTARLSFSTKRVDRMAEQHMVEIEELQGHIELLESTNAQLEEDMAAARRR